MSTIAVLSSKGGVGKTSLAVWLAQAWVESDEAGIVLWDLDPQGSASVWANLPGAQWARGKIDVVPCPKKFNRDKLGEGQRVVLDCPPRLDEQCISAATAADCVAIPVRPGQFDLHAVADTLSLLDAADQYRHKKGLQPVDRVIVPNGLTANSVLSRELVEALRPTNICFEPGLKLRVEYARACAKGTRLPRGSALIDIERLLDRLLRR